ncbi:MHC class II beta chain, partial [Clarias magur]
MCGPCSGPDAPQTSIYPKQKIQLDLNNTLICHATRFFPPHLTVRWTKNNIDVTNQSSLSQYYPNRDNTYNRFSHLHFTPQEGDVYTCTVEHEALETPDTKTWDGHSLSLPVWCFWSKEDLSDMELLEPYVFNKMNYIEFNSTVGRFVGYTELGIKLAAEWNTNPADLKKRKGQVETYCKQNVWNYYSNIFSKTVEPLVELTLVKQSDGSHPAMLMCSAYDFYPKFIKVTWMRNGKEVEGDQTSTEEMADGDWYYQIHSHLEYTPESGEEISCVVEHASFSKPMSYKWDPSMSDADKNKIAIGASGLVLGVVLSGAGFIYYKKKSSVKHHQTALSACSDTDQEYMRGLDEDEVFYSDFTNKRGVVMLPPFSDSTEFPGLYEFSESEMICCKQTLQLWKKEFKDTPVSEDAPQNTIYPRDDIQLGSENTLVCHSTRFFPPPISVRWTKNNVDVTNTSTTSRYYPNRDGTYNQFSHLPFTPQEGDVYTCTVQHKTLETPDTKTM